MFLKKIFVILKKYVYLQSQIEYDFFDKCRSAMVVMC